MRSYTLIVVDDNPLVIGLVGQFCKNHKDIVYLKGFHEPLEALDYLSKHAVDIVILDIEMPNLNGLEFAKMIQPPTKFIFSTSHKNYALEGFELSATDYLLKPYSFERFELAVNKAINLINMEEASKPAAEAAIVVKSSYSNVKLFLKDIQYLESVEDYVIIHLDNEEPVKVRSTLKGISEELPKEEFVRIHRSYIVPLFRVTEYRKTKVLVGETELPVSVSYKDDFLNLMKNR
ncbi:LytTR family DNA-binding domain-containing protein [Fluviicola sp.]|uniref:LytR/AlgR family response regulator transcription factor n=1 Tax=Fluviicola sp. TaxID=1917219 RepID=UPI0031D8998A